MTILQRIANRFGLLTQAQFNAKMREATLGYQAAVVNRLTKSWTQTTLSPDSQARSSLHVIRARSRDLRDNNDYAKKFTTMLKTNVLGDQGIHFRNKAKDPDKVVGGKLEPGKPDLFANRLIEDKWYAWGRKEFCTVTGKLNWCDVQKIALETTGVDGEALVRKVRRKKSENPFGFTLQLIEADYLDDDYDTTLSNGNEVRMGVELDTWGRPLGFHLRTYNPNDSFMPRRPSERRYRVDASEMIHLFINNRSLQTRGMSWLATPAYRMNMLGKYEEAETTKKRAAACKMGFFTKQQANVEYGGEEQEDGSKSMDMEPGAFEELPFNMDVKTVDWNDSDGSTYATFMKTALRAVAASLGVSYNSLAEDMESVNFASGKLGLESERDVWKAVQYWFIESFCEEVFKEWLMSSLTTGALDPLPFSKFDKFNAPYFIGRRWVSIDPNKDVNAAVTQIKNRLTSHSRILAERNIDRDELFDEIADDMKAAEARGFDLDAVDQALKEQTELESEMEAKMPDEMPNRPE